ncbi:hypothetical protein JZ751_010922 [Albula glossodonta]|uniref:Uncharacterized protein n=1 Tax=Albula glossodonta TaxID=121402 RepID=A0A8T2NTH4_9TELE|nr:hypothetical protein JZ751_010922 [Albula glossodonta]
MQGGKNRTASELSVDPMNWPLRPGAKRGCGSGPERVRDRFHKLSQLDCKIDAPCRWDSTPSAKKIQSQA